MSLLEPLRCKFYGIGILGSPIEVTADGRSARRKSFVKRLPLLLSTLYPVLFWVGNFFIARSSGLDGINDYFRLFFRQVVTSSIRRGKRCCYTYARRSGFENWDVYGTYVLTIPIGLVPMLHLWASSGLEGNITRLAETHEAIFEGGLMDSREGKRETSSESG